jgi:6-pyruvoyltetrahydropterin/6-carboxytetrahydropterin synthase
MESATILLVMATTTSWKSWCRDPATGMIAKLADLDSFVERQVLDPFDHKSLNEDVAAFRATVPTTENLCIEIFRRLKPFPNAKLERVRVQETSNNSFEYAGDNPEGFER